MVTTLVNCTGKARGSITWEEPFFVGIPLVLALHTTRTMLSHLKRRYGMSPLMLMMLLSLVPFPVLAIAVLADRWLKGNKALL